jgi:hypothetical protein
MIASQSGKKIHKKGGKGKQKGKMDVVCDDTTPAASPHVSEGPQKHAIAFRSKHIYFEHKCIKNHQYQKHRPENMKHR